jgi:hypothetical protein
MKKILFLICSILLTSCGCVLSQIPPQTIQVNQNCEGILPDYTKIPTATDNCPGTPLIRQSPIAGTILTVNNPAITVVITAVDAFGNVSKPMNVSVTLIDTVKPILHWPVAQINMSEQDMINLYDNWIAAVKVHGIAKWMYDRKWTQGISFKDSSVVDNLKYFSNVIKLTDDEYSQYVAYMITHK